MEKSLTKYIWQHTRPQQIWVLLVVLVSMVTYYLSFDLPKLIINGPITGGGFETAGATQTFMKIAFTLPVIGKVELFSGLDLDRVTALMFLSSLFLALVIVNGAFKFYINTYKGRMGERMLRRIRFELVDRILRFPPEQFKRVKPSEMATMVKDEVEPLGGFIGDAFVQPVLLGGQALTALAFIIVQNWLLGLICLAVVVLQLGIIPRLRKRLLILGRARQLTARELSGRIGEIAEGIGTVHVLDTSNYERADISARLGAIFKIRFDLYQWKFFVKFLNNFLAQVTPFLFYAIGGYLVIAGSLDVGQLVAVIAAYKDLPGPLKDLIDWDQIRQDVAVKYEQVHQQFAIAGLLDPQLQSPEVKVPAYSGASLVLRDVTAADDSGAVLLRSVSATIEPRQQVAVVSAAGTGGDALLEVLGRIVRPTGGKVMIGTEDIFSLPERIAARRIAYASQDPFMFHGTLRANLFYGLKHTLLQPPAYSPEQAKHREWEAAEAVRSGNVCTDINGDWIDYGEAGAAGPHDIYDVAIPILECVCLANDIFELGLRTSAGPSLIQNISGKIMEIRAALRQHLENEKLAKLVVPLDPQAYNSEATVGENLLFGAMTGASFANSILLEDRRFSAALDAVSLTPLLYEAGLKIAANAVELLADLPPDHPAFQKLKLMPPEEVPEYQKLLGRLKNVGLRQVPEADRTRIVALSLSYMESRHRFGLVDEEFKSRIVAARWPLRGHLPQALRDRIEPYEPGRYIAAAALLDNLLFGRIKQQEAEAETRIRRAVRSVLLERGLARDVIVLGLEYQVGVGGKKLTLAQRQKLNLARALLKRSEFLVLNRALSAVDQATQTMIIAGVIKHVKGLTPEPSTVALLSTPALAKMFDRVFSIEDAKLQDITRQYAEEQDGHALEKVLT